MKEDSSIDVLRIIAAFAVVVIHTTSVYINGNITAGNSLWWLANISNSFSRWSVPIFIMISGSLLINDNSFQNTNLFFKKRVQRILIPLIFWSIFFITFNKYITGYFSIKDTVARLFLGEPYYHLWYLYLITGIYFVTPIISLFYANFNQKDRVRIIISIFIGGAINSMWSKYFGQNDQFFVFKFLPYLGYFMLGKEICLTEIHYNKYLYAVIWFFSSVLIALMTALLRDLDFQTTYFYDYLNPLVIVQSISFYVFIKQIMVYSHLSKEFGRILALLSMLTFGIYIIHPVFIELVLKMVDYNDPQLNNMWYLPILTVVVFVVSGILTYILKKIPYLRGLV